MRASFISRANSAKQFPSPIETMRATNPFPFPTQTRVVKPKWATMKLKYAREPWNWTKRPKFEHAGMVETEGHRTRDGRWIKARGVIPKVAASSSPSGGRFGTRVRGYVHPDNRVEKWYMWKGDRVRLLVGKDEDKFVDAAIGAASGYKIYTIAAVDQKRNKVYLEGVLGPVSNPGGLKPANFEELTDEEKQMWKNRNERQPRNRNFQMANLSLLIEEHPDDPSQHVWANRMKTSAARWSRLKQQWVWHRYVSKYTGEMSTVKFEELQDALIQEVPEESHRLEGIYLPFPVGTDEKIPDRELWDGTADVAQTVSAESIDSDIFTGLLEHPSAATLMPATLASPVPTDRSVSEAYRLEGGLSLSEHPTAIHNDTLMPLYLSEELSPRFAKHKKLAAYNLRIANRRAGEVKFVDRAVAEWKAMGKDRFLREIADSPLANLRGVPIKPRSEKEVREAAKIEYSEDQALQLRIVAKKFRLGYLWDSTKNEWKRGPKAERRIAKKERKYAKAEERKIRLANMTLKPAKNMVVPEEILRPKRVRPEGWVPPVREKKKKAVELKTLPRQKSVLWGARLY